MRRVCPAANGILKPSGAVLGKPVNAVGPEVVILPLLAVGDDGRAGRFEPLDGVADGVVVERVEARIVAALRSTASISAGGRGRLPMGSVGIIAV